MARLLFILCLLGGMSCVEAVGTKKVSVKNRDLSIQMADHFEIRRQFSPCLSSDSTCTLKCSASDVKEANLTWLKGNQVCSRVTVIDHNPNPSLHLEVEYQDKNNYSCVLNNPKSMTLLANITQLCQKCTDKTQTALPVKKGDIVTLHTYLKTIQNDTRIVWKFNKAVIAEIFYKDMHIYNCDESFRQLNIQNGDLTITNTGKRDTGIYELQIINKTFSCCHFNVTVSDPLPRPQISNHSNHCPSSGSVCVVECSVVNGRHLSLFWNKGNSILSNITVSDDVNYLCLTVDYKDNSNYSCVVSNSLINETKYLIISEVCSDQSYHNTLKIWKCKRAAQKRNDFEPRVNTAETVQTEDEEVQYAETRFFRQNKQKEKANGTEEIIYSRIVKRH
ncbi:hypothetical protein Q8A67_005732 [Cirrhinus molitorella]|uniref:Ig-like domain-containing protein n=1 Tax=Cirrhinus molitorella TaxID=172907 RepID=A0AA88PZ04_9TELE|nr:hypothetical protein Q8A67_005732 [Cirrhinus molitorella]